jgi:hypothetical protein
MAQANLDLFWSYAQAEINDHGGKLASLRGIYPTTLTGSRCSPRIYLRGGAVASWYAPSFTVSALRNGSHYLPASVSAALEPVKALYILRAA